MNIELKSTGFLIDETITTDLKLIFFGETAEIRKRKDALDKVINKRVFESNVDTKKLFRLTNKLRVILEDCWDAQDEVMNINRMCKADGKWYAQDYESIAKAAIRAQELNAHRNKIIREIDTLLGESEFTQLEKSYA